MPWRPVPGRGGDDVRINVDIEIPREPAAESSRIETPQDPEESMKRRVRITREDVKKYGTTEIAEGVGQ